MNSENSNAKADNLQISGTLKAFSLSLSRLIADKPRVLLMLDSPQSCAENIKDMYEDLLVPENRARFITNIEREAENTDWTHLEQSYIRWGQFGWICTYEIGIDEWDKCPTTQIEADKQFLKKYNISKLKKDILEIHQKAPNLTLFSEAVLCFEQRHYTACASLLCSLIDASLIQQQSLEKFSNRKTGIAAIERLKQIKSEREDYVKAGYFYFELLNYVSFLNILFEPANGFVQEPNRLNRNYLLHGIGKRKVLRKDCIKLFVAYRKTIGIINLNSSD